MKRIAKYLGAFAFLFLAAISCREDDNIRPSMNDNIGAITMVTRNNDHAFFNFLDPLAGQYIEFGLDVDGFDVTQINSVDLEVIYTDKERNYDPFQDIYVDSVFAPVVVKSVTSFPSTVQVSADEIADALGLESVDDFELGDSFNLTFPINTGDGRRLTVALNSELCNQPAQPSFGGCNVAWAISCPSAIPEGVYTATTTTASSTDPCPDDPVLTNFASEVTLRQVGGGVIELSDFFAGVYVEWYGACYGAGPEEANMTDVCGQLSFGFVDQFDSEITGTASYDEATQTITYTWENTFGDTGTTILTPK